MKIGNYWKDFWRIAATLTLDVAIIASQLDIQQTG
jgi:hypothetical protein